MQSLERSYGMVLRYVYLLRRSWPRILELFYWPAVQLILWGFISQFFVTNSTWVAQASGVLMAAVLLWDVLFRAHLGVSLAFFEEMYSRNLGHLFVSPLRVSELIGALLTISLLRTLTGIGGAALLAIPLYDFSIFGLGLPLLVFCKLAGNGVGNWPAGIRTGTALRAGRRKFCLGVDFCDCAHQWYLLPDSGVAGMASGYRLVATVQSRVRGNACADV